MSKIHTTKYAFTLLEVMFALAILTILIYIAQTPMENFHRMVVQQQLESGQKMDIERFYMILKAELIQAGYGKLPKVEFNAVEILEDTVTLNADWNQDGDITDSREHIVYHFDAALQQVRRKSGAGNFQTLIEDVVLMKFLKISDSPVCLKIEVRISQETSEEQTVLCQFQI